MEAGDADADVVMPAREPAGSAAAIGPTSPSIVHRLARPRPWSAPLALCEREPFRPYEVAGVAAPAARRRRSRTESPAGVERRVHQRIDAVEPGAQRPCRAAR